MKTSVASGHQQRDEVVASAHLGRSGPARADAPSAVGVAGSPRMLAQRKQLQATFGAAIQRKIYYADRWWGPNDKEALEQIQGLPKVLPGFLAADAPFVLSSDRQQWVKDVTLEFKGVGRGKGEPDPKRITGGSLEHPLGDVGFGEQSKSRIGPKHLDRRVTRITIFKTDLSAKGHWALQCEVTGGKKTKYMKVDLTDTYGYRILYGATQNNVDRVEFTPRALPLLPSVGLVYWLFVKIAKEKGAWTGNKQYNCQDFALEMLSRLYVNEEDKLAEQREVRSKIKNG